MTDEYFKERMNIPTDVKNTEPVKNELVEFSTPVIEQVSPEVPMTNNVPDNDHLILKTPLAETLVDDTDTNKESPYKAPVSLSEKAAHEALINQDESDHFRTRWNEIQARFVDEPRTAVQQADGLVSEVVEKITQVFASERSSLESQWNQGSEVSTEDLRKTLQHYRTFFNRLVV
jgi:hypothetical protein